MIKYIIKNEVKVIVRAMVSFQYVRFWEAHKSVVISYILPFGLGNFFEKFSHNLAFVMNNRGHS